MPYLRCPIDCRRRDLSFSLALLKLVRKMVFASKMLWEFKKKRVKTHLKDTKREGRPGKDKVLILSWVYCRRFIQRFIISFQLYISFSVPPPASSGLFLLLFVLKCDRRCELCNPKCLLFTS